MIRLEVPSLDRGEKHRALFSFLPFDWHLRDLRLYFEQRCLPDVNLLETINTIHRRDLPTSRERRRRTTRFRLISTLSVDRRIPCPSLNRIFRNMSIRIVRRPDSTPLEPFRLNPRACIIRRIRARPREMSIQPYRRIRRRLRSRLTP